MQAQADPNAPAAPNMIYLPLIAKDADARVIKSKSGIHLGNRSSEWQDAFLYHIQPPPVGAADGKWPAAVVVQSNQVYDIFRPDGTGPFVNAAANPDPCRVNRAAVRQNGFYDYLTRAIKAGTIIVIRITPSPGNFLDYAYPGLAPHTLLTTTIAGNNYCGDPETQKHKVEKYRDIADLAAEMNAIYQVNKAHDWPADHVYFEPANEPNKEWYADVKPITGTLTPNVYDKQAWIDMDNYFAALYDLVKGFDPAPDYDLRVLAPPMSQGLRGEHFALGTCDSTGRTVTGGDGRTGLDFMKQVYGYDVATGKSPEPKADGFSLHNYWKSGQETWDTKAGVSLDFICDPDNGGRNYKSTSDHISQYFPDGIAIRMRSSGKPTFITEADLQSPCQNDANPIKSKDQPSNVATDVITTPSGSLLKFISREFGARYVIDWLLVNQYPDEEKICADKYPNFEINWHEAYLENGDERLWFTRWWAAAQ